MNLTANVFQAGVPNKNGLIYSKEVLQSMVEQYRELIRDGRAFGTIAPSIHTSIDLNKVSHQTVNLEMVGDTLTCEVEILDTPDGRKVMDMLERGIAVTIRPDGIGTVIDNVIQNDYKLISMNIVRRDIAS